MFEFHHVLFQYLDHPMHLTIIIKIQKNLFNKFFRLLQAHNHAFSAGVYICFAKANIVLVFPTNKRLHLASNIYKIGIPVPAGP